MATTVKQAFSDFLSNLEIKDRQVQLVSNRRASVVAALQKELSLHSSEPSKLIGSYDRHTQIRYLYEADVDVMVVLHYDENKEWDNPEGTIKALDRFRSILDDAYPDTDKRRDQNCITMQFSEFRLDVVPAFKFGLNGSYYYKIPDSIRKKWTPTNPFDFAQKVTDVNKTMEDTFVPLIKMVKGWNRHVGWPIRSFHIECMMYDHYKGYDQAYTYSSTLRIFFSRLADYLSAATYDPAMGDRIDTYLDNNAIRARREIAIEKARQATSVSDEAFSLEEGDPKEAIKKWGTLLGEFFPAYG